MYNVCSPRGHWPLRPRTSTTRCGIALVAKLWGEASHAVVEKALDALENLEHRGAEGADPNTGDGAGILLQIPDGVPARPRSPASSCRRRAATGSASATCRPIPSGGWSSSS